MQARLIARHISPRWLGLFLLSLLIVTGLSGWFFADVSRADHPCDGAINANCGFDSFYGSPPRQVPNGWTPFVLSGDLTFMQDSDTLYGAPSLRMWSNGGTFVAGLWQQVKVEAGATYVGSIAWYGPNDPPRFGRQLGLDPTGGTNPGAPSVMWGREKWGAGRIGIYPDDNINVSAVAKGATMTLFVKVNHNSSSGDNYIFLDALALKRDNSHPVQPVAQPTNPPPTNPPPANTVTKVPPPATPTQPAPTQIAPAPAQVVASPTRMVQAPPATAKPIPTQPLVLAQSIIQPTAALAALVFDTPTALPATATPVPTDTAVPTAMAAPTDTPVPSAPATSTPQPPTPTTVPTQAPTTTPKPTRTPIPTATPGALNFLSAELTPGFSTGGAMGLGGSAIGVMLVGLVFVRRRRG